MKPLTLEQQLSRSVHQARAKRIQRMTNAIQLADTGKLAAQVVIEGDLSGLNDNQLATYYVRLCDSLELNHLTKPFTLLKLNGKLIYYANKDCSDQLRKRDKVSVRIVGRDTVGDLLVVTAEAALPDGRVDQSIGALPIGNLKGEALANAMMKCETKAKRRVTLSICGLGFMDESEVEGAQAVEGGEQGTGGSFSPHVLPGEDRNARGDEDLFKSLCGRFVTVETDLEKCDSWEKANALRAILGTRAQQSELTRTMQLKAEAGDISPSQRAELGKTWMRCNRKLEKLEEKLKPSVEDVLRGQPEREPGDDAEEDLL
jgi:hypothetical protein